ncbi:glycosyl transferase [Halobacteroides halobius DSM 5150]|uniref:Glucosyl-3-phosphoglycerate synthase n=1 Tax=Halobacteroides halobius (strain ATCC 35273 / DSM 5150 / MD-1) TaxID=748449 RepID=L0K8X0_HALHC|nr:glycosyltransferase family 2 protein [Halobacteroides halobius]AGB41461.1 glycosyl transferase [Halobacteroides halobius DSM 5150]
MNVALVIPAYNEEERIENVIRTAQRSDVLSEIVVVSDGSTDNTVQVALECNVQTVALPINQGKGAAMQYGVENTDSEIIVFLDADLVNLKVEHIESLVNPIIEDNMDMTCGVFQAGRDSTDMHHKITPWLTGQRAAKREVIESCTDLTESKYGAELSLTKKAVEEKLKVKKVCLKGLTHTTKEEKIGLVKGFWARLKMYWQVISYFRKNDLKYDSIDAVME